MKHTHLLFSLIASLGLVLSASAQDPYEKSDGTYLSLAGTVVTTNDDSFVLDYGEGFITVEMDDWDWYEDAHSVIADKKVTVYGYVDDDWFDTTTIEASSIWIENLNTYFYASSADDESFPVISTVWYDYDYTVTGEVTSVNEILRQFTIDTGAREMTIDTWQLGYNPLDDQGYVRIKKGDRVSVYGDLNLNVFEEREIEAQALVKLEADVGKGQSDGS